MSSFNHKGSSSMTINICEAFGSVNIQDKPVSKQQLTIVINL